MSINIYYSASSLFIVKILFTRRTKHINKKAHPELLHKGISEVFGDLKYIH